MASGSLDALIVPVAEAVLALEDLLAAANGGGALLGQLGYALPAAANAEPLFTDVAAKVASLAASAAAVAQAYADGTWQNASFLPKVLALANAVAASIETAEQLPAKAQTVFAAVPDFLAHAPLDELPRRLVDRLIVVYLRKERPRVAAVLSLLALTSDEYVPADDFNPDYRRLRVEWERIPRWFTAPGQVLADAYGWGSAAFNSSDVLERLDTMLALFGVMALADPLPDALAPLAPPAERLQLPLFSGTVDVPPDGLAGAVLGLRIGRAETAADRDDAGLAITPYADGAAGVSFDLAPGWTLAAKGALDAEGLAVVIQPHTGVRLEAAAAISAEVGVTLARDGSALGPLILFGSAGATRLEIAQIALGLVASTSPAGQDASIELGLHGISLVVQAGEGDGFLKVVLPADPLEIKFDLTLGASAKRGIYFSGGAGFEYTFHVNAQLGPIAIDTIDLAIAVTPTALDVVATTTGALELGPLTAVVEKIGLDTKLSFGQPGNLGRANLGFGFHPPTGLGLSIDASVVSGGGFLSFDVEKQQYSGILQLSIQDVVDVKAIGILNARLPDGRPGYSLLLIITGEFPPIQLGMGFTLNGVGGLIAINRTVVVDVLRAGVRDGGLDAILFPPDPLSHVASLLGTLSAVFPVAENRYVFGPMVRIGWGSPTLITLDLALILEIPDPVRLIILGRLKAVLPNEKAPVVQLRLDALGVLDFSRNEFSLDATLYDSRIVTFALTGDMALRLSWGSQPAFAMALGGFHPAFKPPPGFPALRRLALALSTGDNPRLRMESYFALTSNTVQVGARLELYVKIAAFSLEGGLGFDTLIQFSPFRLLADIDAHLALKRGSTTLMGLDINVHLMGPAPWVLWGQAKFKIFFVSFSIPFRATFGQSQDVPPIERREVWPILRDSLSATASWSAQLPGDSGRLVALRAGAGGDDLLVHPLGTLAVSQNLVPLDRTLGLFGAVPPKDFDRFAIIAATGLDITDTTTQYFAPAQFRQMTDAEKLASPSFERMVSGAQFAPHTAIAIGHVQDTPLDYEQAVILDVDQPASERLDQRYAPAGATVAVLAEHGPAGTAAVRTQGRAKFAPPAPGPKVADPSYVIATRNDLTRVDVDGHDGSYTSAAERLRQRADRDALQIVRAEELELT